MLSPLDNKQAAGVEGTRSYQLAAVQLVPRQEPPVRQDRTRCRCDCPWLDA